MIKRSVCVILENEEGLFLGVSRKYDQFDFGFPGGKVEENETFEEAIIRETKEETGLDIIDLKEIYSCDYQDYESKCYIAKYCGVIQYDRFIETGNVQWVTKDILISGSFGDYNKTAFEIYNNR